MYLLHETCIIKNVTILTGAVAPIAPVWIRLCYTFGKAKFYHYPVSRITLDEAMKEAGLEDIKVEVFEIGHLKLGETTDATALFFATGRMSDSENVIIHKRTLKK